MNSERFSESLGISGTQRPCGVLMSVSPLSRWWDTKPHTRHSKGEKFNVAEVSEQKRHAEGDGRAEGEQRSGVREAGPGTVGSTQSHISMTTPTYPEVCFSTACVDSKQPSQHN